MGMNEFGAGFVLWADDQASKTINDVGDKFKSFAKDSRKYAAAMGAGMVVAGVAMARGLGRAMDQAATLETAVSEVSTLISEDAFPRAKIQEAAQRASQLYGTESQQNAKALYQIISAGVTDAAAAQATLDAANKLSVGGLTDTSIAADGLTNVLLSYRDQQLDVNDVNDAFFTAIKTGKTTAEELAGSIGRVASGANVLGVSMDELLGSISTVTQAGIQTSEAVSGLRAAFGALNQASPKAVAEAKRLGIEYSAAAVRAQGWEGWLNSITQSANYNEDSMSKLFSGVESYNAMVALAANGGKTFNAVMGEMRNRTGATDAAVAKMSETIEHQRKVLEQSVKGIQEAFGGAGNQLLAPFVGLVGKLAGAFSSLANAIPPEARKVIVAVIGGIAGLLTGVGGIALLIGGMSMLGISMGSVALAMAGIAAAMIPLTILTAGFGVAIFAAFRAITGATSKTGETWQDTMGKIKLGWQGLVDLIRDGKLSDAVQSELGKTENQGVGAFLKKAEEWMKKVRAFWSGVRNGFNKGIEALAPAVERMKQVWGDMFGRVFGDSQTTADSLDNLSKSGESLGQRMAGLGRIVIDAFTAMAPFVEKVVVWMRGLTAGDISNGINMMVTAFVGLWKTLEFVATVVGVVYRAFMGLYNLIKLIGNAIGEFFGWIFTTIGQGIDLIGSVVKTLAKTPVGKLIDAESWATTKDAFDRASIMQSSAFEGTRQAGVDTVNAFAGEQVMQGPRDVQAAIQSNLSATSTRPVVSSQGITKQEMAEVLGNQSPPKVNATITVSELSRGDSLVKERSDSRDYGSSELPQGAF